MTSLRLAALVVPLLLAAGPVGPLLADERPAPVPSASSTLTFGVQPAHGGRADSRSAFTFDVDPGAVVSDELLVVNSSHSSVALDVYATDAFQNVDGAFDLLPRGTSPTDVGSWVRPGAARVVVPARGRTVVPFTMTVPPTASPGDHAGGVLVSLLTSRTNTRGDRIEVDQRVGLRVFARVRGALDARVEVAELESAYAGSWNPFRRGRADVRYRIRNTGNVRIAVSDTLTLTGLLGGTAVPRPAASEELLVGGSVVVSTAGRVWPTFTVRAEVTAVPVAGPGELPLRLRPVAASQGFSAVPWSMLALVAATALAAWGLRRRAAAAGLRQVGRHRAERRFPRVQLSQPKRPVM